MKYISAGELDKMISDNSDFQLIDVRESYEYEDENIGGINIPLNDILDQKDKIDTVKPVIFCCQTGKRAAAMTMTLERKYGMQNLHTLEGGVEAFLNLKQ